MDDSEIVTAIRERLSRRGIDLRYLESTGSTNDDALRWLEEGAPEYAAVFADEQTKGRGRLQRKWVTNPGAALAVSVVLYPAQYEIRQIPLFAPLAGIALADALEGLFGLSPQIKWPNDVLLGEKKVSGILAESHWVGSDLRGMVIGTGVNITVGSIPPVEMLTFPATCLESELGIEVNRWQVLTSYLEKLVHWREYLGKDMFLQYWMEHLAFKNREVEISGTQAEIVSGILKGISPEGGLLIQEGTIQHCIQAGDVHLRLRES